MWFLTDGEETFYCEGSKCSHTERLYLFVLDGKSTRIPSNRQDPLFAYFNNEDKGGLTKYQQKMVGMMEKLMETMVRPSYDGDF